MDDCPTTRGGGAAMVLVLIAVPILLSAIYVGGFFTLAERQGSSIRIYRHRWLAELYDPAARAESAITGSIVATAYEGD